MRLIDRILQRGDTRQAFTEILQSGFPNVESSLTDFRTYATEGLQRNGIVWACVAVRAKMVSEARFTFRNIEDNTKVVGPGLELLHRPWPGGTSRNLLSGIESDVSLAGNAFIHKVSPIQLMRLRPDWVGIISDGQAPIAYLYTPGGTTHSPNAALLTEDRPIDHRATGTTWLLTSPQIAHYAPNVDPLRNYVGLSWITSVAREIDADTGMTTHKQRFLENAATPNLIIKLQGALRGEARDKFRDDLNRRHEGTDMAYKTMILDQGADVTVAGANLRQMSFAAVQGAGETRIAAAAEVPPIIVGLSEGLQAATYSNYALAMRRWNDLWASPTWGGITDSIAHLVTVPDGFRLGVDASMIPALQQDALDAANIVGVKARSMMTLIQAGYDADQVASAVDASDLTQLTHTGNLPTTLYPEEEPGDEDGSSAV